MKQKEFSRYMTAVVNGMMAIKENMESDNKQQIVQHARWAYRKVINGMNDAHGNVRLWLERRTCLFRHPIMGHTIQYPIGNDFEALYYFLEWCRRMEEGETVDEDFEAYVAYVISRSNAPSWEEA